jgi:hypothetical protein
LEEAPAAAAAAAALTNSVGLESNTISLLQFEPREALFCRKNTLTMKTKNWAKEICLRSAASAAKGENHRLKMIHGLTTDQEILYSSVLFAPFNSKALNNQKSFNSTRSNKHKIKNN